MLFSLTACNALTPLEGDEAAAAPEPSSFPTPTPAPVETIGQVRVLCDSASDMAHALIRKAQEDRLPVELIVTEFDDIEQANAELEAGSVDIVIGKFPADAKPGFVPLAYSAYVLAVNDTALRSSGFTDSAFSSMESLFDAARQCGESKGKAFFAVDSYTELFAYCMRQLGELFTGEFDTENESFVHIYNLIAEAAFTGGIADTSNALASVRNGDCVCAAVPAASLTDADISTLRILPLPMMKNGSRIHSGICTGYAVLREGEAVKAAADWLMRSETTEYLALSVRAVPSVCTDKTPEDALSAALCDISKTCTLAALNVEAYSENAEQFENDFRAAMEMLAE